MLVYLDGAGGWQDHFSYLPENLELTVGYSFFVSEPYTSIYAATSHCNKFDTKCFDVPCHSAVGLFGVR